MPALRARDIIRGVVPALAIAVPAVVAQVVVRPGPGGELGLYVLLLAGLVLGGWRAGRLGVSAPMSSGALAALVAFALVQIAAVVVGQLNNRPLPPVAPIVFNPGWLFAQVFSEVSWPAFPPPLIRRIPVTAEARASRRSPIVALSGTEVAR